MDQDHAAAEWAEICSQRHLQVFDAIDQDLARRILAVIADIGTKEDLSLTIAVHLGEQLVFQSALDGTTAAHDGWAFQRRWKEPPLPQLRDPQIQFPRSSTQGPGSRAVALSDPGVA
jgi:uncharacterized protein (UPF0303 family)